MVAVKKNKKKIVSFLLTVINTNSLWVGLYVHCPPHTRILNELSLHVTVAWRQRETGFSDYLLYFRFMIL